MTTHKLKCWPEPFEETLRGNKTHEFRKDDRDYQVGDRLVIQEYAPITNVYSGRELHREVTYIGRGYGIPEGYVCMSVTLAWPQECEAVS